MNKRRIFGHGIWMTCVKQEGWRDETKNFISASGISLKTLFLPILVHSPKHLTQSLCAMGLLNKLVTWGPFLERSGQQTFHRKGNFKIKTF